MKTRTKRGAAPDPGARANQQLRTRQDLLRAAARLLQSRGAAPSLDDVAAEALVSRATAYRYFPSIEALLAEAPLDGEVPTPESLFAGVKTADAEARVDLAEAALHRMVYANAPRLKAMLVHSLRAGAGAGAPVRQNRRSALIQAALAPVRDQLDKAAYGRLCAALALVFGTESMVVLTDVHPVSPDEARAV
jgi:AcrR family transcriptional regulator